MLWQLCSFTECGILAHSLSTADYGTSEHTTLRGVKQKILKAHMIATQTSQVVDTQSNNLISDCVVSATTAPTATNPSPAAVVQSPTVRFLRGFARLRSADANQQGERSDQCNLESLLVGRSWSSVSWTRGAALSWDSSCSSRATSARTHSNGAGKQTSKQA